MAHVYLISLPPLCTNIYIVWSLVEVNICISCLFPWQKIDMMLGYHKTNENHLQEHIKHVKSSSNSHSSSFFFLSLSLQTLVMRHFVFFHQFKNTLHECRQIEIFTTRTCFIILKRDSNYCTFQVQIFHIPTIFIHFLSCYLLVIK